MSFLVTRKGTRFRKLTATPIDPGTTIVITCRTKRKAKGCAFKSKTLNPAAGKPVNLASLFKKRRLPAGTVVTVRIMSDSTIGEYGRRITIRKNKKPAVKQL
jgi:hypothetical protein